MRILHFSNRKSLSIFDIRVQEDNVTTPSQSRVTGMLAIYAKLALQADEGGGWPARWEDFD